MQIVRKTVLVLGANGNFGQAAVTAFAKAGWHVIAQARSGLKAMVAGLDFIQCDALDTSGLLAQLQFAKLPKPDVVVHALNPNYAHWESMLPPVTAAAIKIAKASNALMMVPGNVYNFGNQLPELLTEQTSFFASNTKARLRIEMEQQIAEEAQHGLQSVIIRAGDFMGGNRTWFDMAITKSLHKNCVTHMGPDHVQHAWAYLPDLAEVFVRVAEQRQKMSNYTVLHYPGFTLTGQQLHQSIEQLLGHPLKHKNMHWGMFKLMAIFSPLLKSVMEMQYLWQRSHQLDGKKLESLIGPLPSTSLAQALKVCISS